MSTQNCSENLIKIIKPVIDELAILEGGIGFIDIEEFVDAMNRLFKTLNSQEKNILLNFDKAPRAENSTKDSTFK